LGVPLYVNWTVLLAIVLLTPLALTSPIFGALFIGSYLAAILVHELGHAFVARRLGYEVEAIGLTMLHGWCRCEAPDDEWHAVLIAWGGVGAQLVAAFPVLVVTVALGDGDWGYLTPIIVVMGYMNVVIAIMNLLPADDSDAKVAWRIVPLLLEKWQGK
jgi:Zn-dependent protease